jgi:SAM-dependent methyltransferase
MLEATALAPFIRRLHGDSIVWVGDHATSADSLQRCMVRNSFFLQQDPTGSRGEIPSFSGQLEALPFKSNSVDGIVLHHALEVAQDPRVSLREVTRVLVPGGRVLICGFNPLSLIGLRRLYARVVDDSLSSHRLINPIRLFDWLTLLGYELEGKPLYSGYALPFKRLMRKFDLPNLERRVTASDSGLTVPFGSLLVVNAVKQAVSARPQWRGKKDRRRLAPVAYPRVASWQRIKP